MTDVVSQSNPYLVAFEALDLRESATEQRDDRESDTLADRYHNAIGELVKSHVEGNIHPPLPEDLAEAMVEVFEDYEVKDGRSRHSRVVTIMDLTNVSGHLVQRHKDVFRSVVEHGLASLVSVGQQEHANG